MALMIPRKVLELVKILYYCPLHAKKWYAMSYSNIKFNYLFLQLSREKCYVYNIFIINFT